MLSAVTKKARVWAAAFLAVFYAVCLLAPAAAFAFGNPEAHCLTEDNHGMGVTHVHDDGVVHTHGSTDASQTTNDAPDGDGKAKAKCCGLLCLTALAVAVNDDLTPASHPHAVFPAAGDSLVGGIPARLYRPPALAI
jgi:hypothetical protein